MKLEPDEEKSFLMLKRIISNQTNLDCSIYKDNYIKRRLMVRTRANGFYTFSEYYKFLKTYPEEYDILLETLTINVTEFFRDPSVFKVVGDEVIPDLLYEKISQRRKVIRIWSAGCSSGEEAYSLAIMFYELLGERMRDLLVSIHGTDIDDESLKKAKKGEYLVDQLKNMGDQAIEKYFTVEDGKCQIKDEIKEFVRFKKLDLLAEKKGANFDLIFNRNVMIYFSKDMQKKLLMDFYNSLNDGGYLVIGKTEMLMGEARDLFKMVNTRERIYQKEKRKRWSESG